MLEKTNVYHEIHQQPAVLSRLLTQEKEVVQHLAAAIKTRGITHVVIAARCPSVNAGRYAQYL